MRDDEYGNQQSEKLGSSEQTGVGLDHWDGDFPDFWVLRPNESAILEVDLTSGDWNGFPDLYGERIRANLTATYENKTDPLADAYNIWVGKVVSNPVEVIFK